MTYFSLILRRKASDNQTLTSSKIEADWSNLFFKPYILERFSRVQLVVTSFFISRASHITKKLWIRTALTVGINLYIHIYWPFFVCWRCGIWKSYFRINNVLSAVCHVILRIYICLFK